MSLPTVLIVDDNRVNRELYAELLDLADCRAVTAGTVQEALAQASQSQPALILLDLTLAGQSGFTVAEGLRQSPATAQIPILALTGVQRPSLVSELKAAGFMGMIAKPCGVNAFLEAIGWALETAFADFRTFA